MKRLFSLLCASIVFFTVHSEYFYQLSYPAGTEYATVNTIFACNRGTDALFGNPATIGVLSGYIFSTSRNVELFDDVVYSYAAGFSPNEQVTIAVGRKENILPANIFFKDVYHNSILFSYDNMMHSDIAGICFKIKENIQAGMSFTYSGDYMNPSSLWPSFGFVAVKEIPMKDYCYLVGAGAYGVFLTDLLSDSMFLFDRNAEVFFGVTLGYENVKGDCSVIMSAAGVYDNWYKEVSFRSAGIEWQYIGIIVSLGYEFDYFSDLKGGVGVIYNLRELSKGKVPLQARLSGGFGFSIGLIEPIGFGDYGLSLVVEYEK